MFNSSWIIWNSTKTENTKLEINKVVFKKCSQFIETKMLHERWNNEFTYEIYAVLGCQRV